MTIRTVTTISDDIFALNEQIKKLSASVKELEEKKNKLEYELIMEAEKAGLDKGGGKTSKFTIKESIVPVVAASDWDKLYAFIAKKKWFHLLERRPSLTGCRELWEQGKEIPGVSKFTKRKVTVTGV